MRFNHVPAGSRETWSNTLFELNGDGGGRNFRLSGVDTDRFANIIKFSGSVGNQDTNTVRNCTFNNFKTFLYIRNNGGQAVVNEFSSITWGGYVDKVFDISGFGNTHINTANVVQSGDFLYLTTAQSGLASIFTCVNVRFEYWNSAGTNANGTTRFVNLQEDAGTQASIKFINCAVFPRFDTDPGIYQFDVQGGTVTLDVDGGTWGGARLRVRGRFDETFINQRWVRFVNCRQAVLPSDIQVESGTANAGAVTPVIYRNCFGIPNMTFRGAGGSFSRTKASGTGEDRNNNTITGAGGYLIHSLSVGGLRSHALNLYGNLTMIEKIRVFVGASFAGTPTVSVKAYKNAEKTIQIGQTINITNYSVPMIYDIGVSENTFTTEGVFLDVEHVSGGSAILEGMVYIDTLSV